MTPEAKPSLDEYEAWLDARWAGDARELRKGRYLYAQGELLRAFNTSDFATSLQKRLSRWSEEYYGLTGYPLFSEPYRELHLDQKSWESFLNRTYRRNVLNNDRWPAPPPDGWLFPDNWFERVSDVIRGRFVVRYLDGVGWLVERLLELARDCGRAPKHVVHAQEWGYYAMHVGVPQAFTIYAVGFEHELHRESRVEIQVTTALQELIGQLTHPFFERRRIREPVTQEQWQWNYKSDEFVPNYLGHVLHYLEGVIMQLRDGR